MSNSSEKIDTYILDKKKLWLICPKCKNIPLLTIKLNNESKEVSIHLKCRCSNYREEQYTIKEYLSQITQKQKHKMCCTANPAHSGYLAVNYCFQCQQFLCSLCKTIHSTLNKEHSISDEEIKIDKICDRHIEGNEIVSHCLECNTNLCSTCLKEHNIHHDIYDLRNFFPKNLCDKYYEDFKLIHITFFKYINEAKKIIDEKILEEKRKEEDDTNKNEELKTAVKNMNCIYEKNNEMNQDLIKLISLMFENYYNTIESTPYFNIIYQLKSLTRFNSNLKSFKYDENISLIENITNFINYLKKVYIIKTIDIPLEIKEITKIPKLNNTRVLISLGGTKLASGNMESDIQIFDLNSKNVVKHIVGHLNKAKEDFPVIELTEEEKEKLEKEKSQREKTEKSENENNITNTNNSNNVEEIQAQPQPELFYLNLENLACFELPDKVFDICESKDGSLIACCLDKSLKIYNMENLSSPQPEKEIKLDYTPTRIACLPDGRIVVAFGENPNFGIKIYKLDENKELVLQKEFIEHQKLISCLYILEDGKIVTTSMDGTAVFYNPFDFNIICKIEENKKKNFTSVVQLEDRSVVISAGKGIIYVLQ